MAELSQQERLQPSLLDRLTDDAPGEKVESRDKRVLSIRQYRQGVLRDLAWLLNSTNLHSMVELKPFPHAAQSVINYGLPDLAGRTSTTADIPSIERGVRQAIIDFEPRILRNSVKIRIIADAEQMNHNAMNFDIEGELWAQPVPLRLLLRSELDLETGSIKLSDFAG
jgi:type VI secretion system protein ImpF